MPKYAGFVGGSYSTATPNIDAQRAVNLFVETVESGAGKNRAVLLGTPGTTVWATAPKSPVRALWSGDEGQRCYCVAGDTLYEVSSGGVFTSRGVVGDDASHSPAKIIANGNSILILSAGFAYVDNGAVGGVEATAGIPEQNEGPGSLTPVTGTTDSASGADFIDGYFIVSRPDSKQINISGINNALTWDGLDFEYKISYPDNIVTILADSADLWIFGQETTEVWRNNGSSDFPFERDPGGSLPYGNVAPHATNRLAGGVAWLSGDSRGSTVAQYAKGYAPKRISHHALEAQWRTYATVADATGYTYSDNGHEFWVVTFPTANKTWVYDAITGLWHERSWWTGSAYARHRGRCHAAAFNKHLIGDHTTGVIYELTNTTYEDFGGDIKRLRTAPHISDEDDPIFYHRLEVDMLTGGGVTSTTATMQYSDDGGITWSTAKTVSGGAYGAFNTRVVWRRLGRSRDRVFSVEFVSDGPISIVDAYLKLTPGAK